MGGAFEKIFCPNFERSFFSFFLFSSFQEKQSRAENSYRCSVGIQALNTNMGTRMNEMNGPQAEQSVQSRSCLTYLPVDSVQLSLLERVGLPALQRAQLHAARCLAVVPASGLGARELAAAADL